MSLTFFFSQAFPCLKSGRCWRRAGRWEGLCALGAAAAAAPWGPQNKLSLSCWGSGEPRLRPVLGQKGPFLAAFLCAGQVAAGQAGPAWGCCLPPSSQRSGHAAAPARSRVTPIPAFAPGSCADTCLVSLRRAQPALCPGWVFAEGQRGTVGMRLLLGAGLPTHVS